MKPSLTLNYGLRYDYYVPLTEEDNRISKFNIDTGTLDPNTTPFYQSKKNSFQPRVGATRPRPRRQSFAAGSACSWVRADRRPDSADRGGPHRRNRVERRPEHLSVRLCDVCIEFHDESEQPKLPAARLLERVHAAREDLPVHGFALPGAPWQIRRRLWRMSAQQGRNLFLRTIANQTIGVELLNGAPTQIREFDIITRNADGTLATIQRPYAEIDYKTSGGHDSYNSMQLALTRRSSNGLVLNGQYTLGYSKGNSGGSNEVDTAGDNSRLNNASLVDAFSYDDGYNKRDVRHTFSFSALYTIPGNGLLTGGWSIGGIANARSGYPIFVVMNRPDIVYLDAAGNVFTNFVAGRTPVVNVPGGGAAGLPGNAPT